MKTITYEPSPGNHISFASRSAVSLARSERARVRFNFNEIPLFATPKKSPFTLEWEFEKQMRERADRPSARAARLEWKRETEQRRSEDQATIDRLMMDFFLWIVHPPVNLDDVMRWLGEFTPAADTIGVNFPREQIIAALEAAGFKDDAHVGTPSNQFTRQMSAEWTIGQAINCMKHGMPPHPMAAHFVEKYFVTVDA